MAQNPNQFGRPMPPNGTPQGGVPQNGPQNAARPGMPGQPGMPGAPMQPGMNPNGYGRPMPPGYGAPHPGQPGMPMQPGMYGQIPAEVVEEVPEEPIEKISLDEIHLDDLLKKTFELKGSDLHLAVNRPPCVRVHGKIHELKEYDTVTGPILQRMIYDILTDEQIQRFENEWELDFAYTAQYVSRFRVNAYKDRGYVATAMRVIPSKMPTPEELGLPQVMIDLANRPRGLFLVTGPTGSGKSTTLAAIINYINMNHEGHILTIEDPIEFVHEHKRCVVNQREVGIDTRSFSNALRAALREDPDVILVGEMRDNETIHLAITAAETGHLVFGTLHTNSAAESVDRMVGVFPSEQQEQIRTQLSNSLVAIITQQLLPKVGGGRIAAIEIMIANSAIRNLIREAKAHQMVSIMQTQTNIGMQTMDQALRDLYFQGNITYDDAMARSHNAAELEAMVLKPNDN